MDAQVCRSPSGDRRNVVSTKNDHTPRRRRHDEDEAASRVMTMPRDGELCQMSLARPKTVASSTTDVASWVCGGWKIMNCLLSSSRFFHTKNRVSLSCLLHDRRVFGNMVGRRATHFTIVAIDRGRRRRLVVVVDRGCRSRVRRRTSIESLDASWRPPSSRFFDVRRQRHAARVQLVARLDDRLVIYF